MLCAFQLAAEATDTPVVADAGAAVTEENGGDGEPRAAADNTEADADGEDDDDDDDDDSDDDVQITIGDIKAQPYEYV